MGIATFWQKMNKSFVELAFNPLLALISGRKTPIIKNGTMYDFHDSTDTLKFCTEKQAMY